ncbi:hypothetical protein Tco_1099474 [Tanacetum coccineum]
MEKVVKSRRVVLTDSEDEGAENSSKQGRNLQKDESEVFETPKQGKSSGETDISPQGLEAAEVLSQIKTKRRNVKTIVRRRLDAEDVSTTFTDIKSASEKVSSGGEHVSASQREGKAVLEETPQTKRTKKQIREEQASLAEIARIQAEEEAENARREELKRQDELAVKTEEEAKNARREELKRQDELAAKRLQEELELSEAQKKRMAQVQEATQFYTEEDWDIIRAKIAGEDVSEADYAQIMVGLISQADQAGTQSQPSSSTVPPPPTSQPAPTESTTIPPTPVNEPTFEPSSPPTAPEHETMEHPFERQESDIPQTQAPTHTHEAETWHMLVDDLFQLVPQLMTRIESLEKDLKQTKQTMGNAIVKLVKKVKKLEKVVKGRRVVLTDSEDEAAENSSKQGRNLQKDESKVFETPKQGKSSGETDISPQGLEAAETLAEALSQIKTKRRNVKTGVRRRLDAEDVSTGFEDVSTGFTDIKSASEKVSSGGEHVSASQREGKAVLEETPQTKRTKKQIREEQASLAEIARIQAEEEAENARREELKRQDELAAKRLQEELELSEAQKKRMAQVQEAAQFYTEEDWDTIQAKLEANADLVKEIAGEDVSEADYAQRMVGLISQADQAGTQSQPSSSTVPPPPTSQPAPTESTTIPPTPVTEPTSEPSSPSTAPEHQPSSPRQESDIPQTQAPTHTHEAETRHILEKDLKQTKQTMGNAIVKLVKKVKKMEKVLKSRRVVLTDSEDEAAENSFKQGRNLQKVESEVFETPKQGKSSGETDIKSASEKVSSGGEHVSQREGKTVLEETPQTKRTKKQIREEQASLAEIARIQDVSEADYAQRMMGLISQRRKLIAEQKAKAQRDKL